VYLTCSEQLTGSQLSLPHGINKKLKCETKNKTSSSAVAKRPHALINWANKDACMLACLLRVCHNNTSSASSALDFNVAVVHAAGCDKYTFTDESP